MWWLMYPQTENYIHKEARSDMLRLCHNTSFAAFVSLEAVPKHLTMKICRDEIYEKESHNWRHILQKNVKLAYGGSAHTALIELTTKKQDGCIIRSASVLCLSKTASCASRYVALLKSAALAGHCTRLPHGALQQTENEKTIRCALLESMRASRETRTR
eukprot:IDg19156t1